MTALVSAKPIRSLFSSLAPKRIRKHAEFACSEIILPDGPHAGERFSFSTSPWTRLLLAEYDNPKWRRFFIAGSVQSGKTLLGFIEPLLYVLFELEETAIIGVPVIDLAQGIWEQRIRPVIARTRYRDFLPQRGPGSKGGKIRDYILFRHGVVLRFMGAGGGDEQRSSYPSRFVFLTELDKMDTPGEVSRETDPTSQIEARTTAFGSSARIWGECTVSVREGKIWREVTSIGSNSQILIRCPHCGKHIYPERGNFRGWEDETVLAAERGAYYECQECKGKWDEAARQTALAEPVMKHENLETDTFGLRYNMMHSGLVTMADIAREHWKAKADGSVPAEKKVCQFVWSSPWVDEYDDDTLTVPYVLTRAGEHNFGEVPQEADFTVGAIDVQKYWLYGLIEAYRAADMTCWTVAWRSPDIMPKEFRNSNPTAPMVRDKLNELYDEMVISYNCRSIWIDCGYRHEASTQQIVKEWAASKQNVFPLVGRGHGQSEHMSGKQLRMRSWRVGDGTVVQSRRQADRSILWFLDVDVLKLAVHESLRIEQGKPGCRYFPRQIMEREHKWIAEHLVAEQFMQKWEPGKGMVRKWVENKRRHDILDCAAYARGGAMYERERMVGAHARGNESSVPWTARKVRR